MTLARRLSRDGATSREDFNGQGNPKKFTPSATRSGRPATNAVTALRLLPLRSEIAAARFAAQLPEQVRVALSHRGNRGARLQASPSAPFACHEHSIGCSVECRLARSRSLA